MVDLRVAFFGNIANNFYQIAKALRSNSNIEAYLYIEPNEAITSRPESDDPDLKNGYPAWIISRKFVDAKALLMPGRSLLVKELSQYDIVILSGTGPAFAPFIKRPTCFLVTGGDLTTLPFPLRYLSETRGLKGKLKLLLVGFWQRQGIRHVGEIWLQPFSPYTNALRTLGFAAVDRRISPVYFPLIIDTERFKFDPAALNNPDPQVKSIKDRFDFTIFHPSRLMIRNDPRFTLTGQWKQNDVLIRGFAQFLKTLEPAQAARAALLMPDRIHSPDIDLAKQIIAEFGLEQNVVWLKSDQREGLSRQELILFYSICDVAADDFGIGWFGSVVLEASSIGRPVLTYIDENAMCQLYAWHPFLSANTVEGIAAHLSRLYHDPQFKEETGRKGHRWIEEFHAPQAASQIYVKRIQELIGRLDIKKAR